jgi:hypothetical protein
MDQPAWNGTRIHIGIDGARVPAAALERNTTLTFIDLRSNTFDDSGHRGLLTALEVSNFTLCELGKSWPSAGAKRVDRVQSQAEGAARLA